MLITTALIPSSTILITGKILKTAPNTAQRHLETLREASVRAISISDPDDILASGAMRDIRSGMRGSPVPVLSVIEILSARNMH